MGISPSRHVPIGVIEDYVVHGLEGVIGYAGTPTGRLQIDPQHQTLAIEFPAVGRAPNVVEYENLSFSEVVEGGDLVWHRLAIRLDDNLDEVYALLCAILDRVQLAGEPFADAVESARDSLSGIIAFRHCLTRERQVGLFGELLVLLALTESVGPRDAMYSWRGPLGEEHDFGIVMSDIEVKTTLGERREHWISSTTQLVQTGERPLYLISIQLTTGALDSGLSLPALIALARSRLALELPKLDSTLALSGFRDRDSDLYHSRWTLRKVPTFYEINSLFPAVTPERLDAIVPRAEHVIDVRYRLDLTGISQSPALFEFGEFL